MSWLKGSLNRAVASSPTLSSAVAKASTAAGSAYGFVAPSISKAVSAVSDRLGARQELTAAVRQLEKLARDARGPLRCAVLRRWLELLRGEDELPASPQSAPVGDEADVAPPPAALSASEAKQVFPAPRSAFVDTDGRGTLTFRDVLLRSAALELLANNVLAEPPASADEAALLRDVFAATLVGGAASAKALVAGLAELTPRLAGYTAEVKASRAELAAVLSAAVAALKTAPAEETARAAAARAAAALADAAAAADAGDASGDAAADTTGAALAAARELDAALSRARSSLAERVQLAPLSASAAALGALGGELGAALTQLKSAGADAARQLADSDAMRGGKLAGADVTMQALAAEVSELSAREAELQAELDRVSTRLAKALLRQAQAREEREAFETGSGDAREALDSRRASLAEAEAAHAAEAAAVAGWAAFVAAADAQRDTALAAAAEAATAAAASGAAKHAAALAAHVAARARQAGVLVGRVRFCCAELDDASAKAGQMAELGMSVIAADLAASRAKLESQYVEAEEALATLLADAAALRTEAGALAPPPAGVAAQMESSLAHLAAVAKEFEARTRPRLLREEQAAKLAADAAAAAAAHAAAPAPEVVEEAEPVTVMESVPESPTKPEPAPAAAAPETPPAPAAVPAVAEEEDALDTAAVADEPSAEEIAVDAPPAATAEA